MDVIFGLNITDTLYHRLYQRSFHVSNLSCHLPLSQNLRPYTHSEYATTSCAMVKSIAFLTLFLCSQGVASMTDAATGISFPDSKMGKPLFGVGVRKKGPIKIYSVAMYCSQSVRDRLEGVSKSEATKAFEILRDGAKDHSTTFLLNMNFKVGAEKMASAIADSVAPRHKGSTKDVEALKSLIFSGVEAKGAASKGTTFQFDCSKTGVSVAVDGKRQGNVSSESLAAAFCDVYLDKNCVSPALCQSCVDNCCKV